MKNFLNKIVLVNLFKTGTIVLFLLSLTACTSGTIETNMQTGDAGYLFRTENMVPGEKITRWVEVENSDTVAKELDMWIEATSDSNSLLDKVVFGLNGPGIDETYVGVDNFIVTYLMPATTTIKFLLSIELPGDLGDEYNNVSATFDFYAGDKDAGEKEAWASDNLIQTEDFILLENECGDGEIDASVEMCDDGNLVNGDGCSDKCRWELDETPRDPGDVVLNEISWAGTENSARDEWIELKNNTDSNIPLVGWAINFPNSSDKHYIEGTIPANGFFLVELHSDASVPDISADQILPNVTLQDGGEDIELLDDLGTVIDSIDGSSGWPAGEANEYRTMERDPDGAYYDSFVVYGTPRQENSMKAQCNDEIGCSISQQYGGGINALVVHGDYIYAGGNGLLSEDKTENRNVIKRYRLSDLSYVDESPVEHLGLITTLTVHGDYIYAGESWHTAGRVKKYSLTDLSFAGQSEIYYNNTYILSVYDDYIYVGTEYGRALSLNLSDLSYVNKGEYPGNVRASVVVDDYLYIAGTASLKRYNLPNLDNMEEVTYGSRIFPRIRSIQKDGEHLYLGSTSTIIKYGLREPILTEASHDYQQINSLSIYHDYLYVGGSFYESSSYSSGEVGVYRLPSLERVEPDMDYIYNGSINALVTVNDYVYVAGSEGIIQKYPTINTVPEIILLGDNPMTLEYGQEYIEPGFEVAEGLEVSIVGNDFDTNTPGIYEIVYSVVDSGGLSDEVVRTVVVSEKQEVLECTLGVGYDGKCFPIELHVSDNWVGIRSNYTLTMTLPVSLSQGELFSIEFPNVNEFPDNFNYDYINREDVSVYENSLLAEDVGDCSEGAKYSISKNQSLFTIGLCDQAVLSAGDKISVHFGKTSETMESGGQIINSKNVGTYPLNVFIGNNFASMPFDIDLPPVDATPVPSLINSDYVLRSENSPYVIMGEIMVTNNAKFTVDPGVVIKFMQSSVSSGKIISDTGWIDVAGTETEPVVFTSISDDKYAGDINRDGDLTAPSSEKEEFGGILLSTDKAFLTANHVSFNYANSSALSMMNGASANMYNVTAKHNNTVISVEDGSSVYIHDAQIYYNDIGIWLKRSSIAGIYDSHFYLNNYGLLGEHTNGGAYISNTSMQGHFSAAIFSFSPHIINAKGNWWGSNFGPVHQDNLAGAGDVIVGNIDYSNWRKHEIPENPPQTFDGMKYDKLCPDTTLENLVIVTHGWKDDADSEWLDSIVDGIKNNVNQANNEGETQFADWEVCKYDWGEDSLNFFTTDPFSFAKDSANLAWANAYSHGMKLGEKLAEMDHKNIHFIAHSAGSNLIQTAIETLTTIKRKNDEDLPVIHSTYLDAYAPYDREYVYGNLSDFSDHYVVVDGYVLDTDFYLNNSYNIDVSLFEPSDNNPFTGGHGYPVQWYIDSITAGTKYGYGFSLEKRRDSLPSYSQYPRGGHCVYTSEDLDECRNDLNFLEYVTYRTIKEFGNFSDYFAYRGSVGYYIYGVLLKPESPAWVEYEVELEEETDWISFDYQFSNDENARGILTVFMNGELVFKADQDAAGVEVVNSSRVSVGDLNVDIHKLRFRIDPVGETKGNVFISNVIFGVTEIEKFVDNTAPSTDITVIGDNIKDGLYLGKIDFVLESFDNPDGIGVQKIEYSFDNGTTWHEYTEPVPISEYGQYTMLYRSIDWFGNQEEDKSVSFRVVNAEDLLLDALNRLQNLESDNSIKQAIKQLEQSLDDKYWQDKNTLSKIGGKSVFAHLKNAINTIGDDEALKEITDDIKLAKEILLKHDQEETSSISDTGSFGGSGYIANHIREDSIRVGKIANNSATVNWLSSQSCAGKIVYSSEDSSHEFMPENTLNYGYSNFLNGKEKKATGHEIKLEGLESGTTYYFRVISSCFPDVISKEHSFTTKGKKEEIKVLGLEYSYTDDVKSLYGQSKDLVEMVSLEEAELVFGYNDNLELTEKNQEIFDKITNSYSLSEENSNSVRFFIQEGTKTTKRLGAGERAGVISSYLSTYGIFPGSIADWQDIIKIANGRWPGKSNEEAKTKASGKFSKVYKRNMKKNNQNDDSAISIIAYGLRPVNRNMESEKSALKTFKDIYGDNPRSAMDWDLIRAIAYSGSKR